MCGRYACSLDIHDLRCALATKSNNSDFFKKPALHESAEHVYASYNIPPTTVVPVIVSTSQKLFKNLYPASRVIVGMRFGLIPSWMTQLKTTNSETHLCQSENISRSKLFKPLYDKGYHCVVPCIGFYEWQPSKTVNKQPYFFFNKLNSRSMLLSNKGNFCHKEGWNGPKLLFLAGLYSPATDPKTGKKTYSFSILTKEASKEWRHLHHRLPIILQSELDITMWLRCHISDEIRSSIFNREVINIDAYPVNKNYVNNSRNDDLKCLEPVNLDAPIQFMKSWLSPTTKSDDKSKETRSTISIKKWLNGKNDSKPESTVEKGAKNAKKRTLLEDWLETAKKPKNN